MITTLREADASPHARSNRTKYAYDAFGDDLGSSGSFENAYGFTGRERDGSGLYYYRARYYLPRIGRFLSPDPLGLAGGTNPYAYAASNPVNFTDPLGLTPIYSKGSLGNAISPVSFPAFAATPSTPMAAGSGSALSGGYSGSGYSGGGFASVPNAGGAPLSYGPGTWPSGGPQPVTGTFNVPLVRGMTGVRAEFFIAAPVAFPGLAGDARSFDVSPNPEASRASFTLDFDTGKGAFQINPSCFAGGIRCRSALPIGSGNSFDAVVSGRSVTVTGSLTNSLLGGPSIDFGVTFHAGPRGVTFGGYRNAYPSLELTQGSTFLYKSPETNPLRLIDTTRFEYFTGP